jgi:copper chaperone CopZ
VVTTSPVKLHVLGMSCPKCVSNVDIQLMRVPGVQKAAIDMGSGIVVVDFDPSKKITRAALAKAVDDSGLTIASIEIDSGDPAVGPAMEAKPVAPFNRCERGYVKGFAGA